MDRPGRGRGLSAAMEQPAFPASVGVLMQPGSGRSIGPRSTAVLTNHQLQSGPRIVNRANLDVYQPHWGRNVPNCLLGDVRWNA